MILDPANRSDVRPAVMFRAPDHDPAARLLRITPSSRDGMCDGELVFMDGINRVLAVLEDIEDGDYATKGREFGRGMAFAAAEIRAALQNQPREESA